jgi:hypothetical protein
MGCWIEVCHGLSAHSQAFRFAPFLSITPRSSAQDLIDVFQHITELQYGTVFFAVVVSAAGHHFD